jgi:hypothetical protein
MALTLKKRESHMETKHEQVKFPRLNNDEQKLSLLERALSTPLFFSEKGFDPSLLKDADLSKLSRKRLINPTYPSQI